MEDSILDASAAEQVQAIVDGDLSAVELMNATYDRLERVNPAINALVNVLSRDRAVALAADSDLRRGQRPAGLLEGLPFAVKDLVDVRGFPTTSGFVPFKDRVAAGDSPMVARIRAAGAIFIGKSNTPEFGFGSHTFNRLFGMTRNPYDPGRSAGGSSGGAAAALATGLVSVADGSDFGGSLRNPASFCNVVGLRPSIGRISDVRGYGWLGRIGTSGPMARSVADLARLFAVQVHPETSDPLSLDTPGDVFRAEMTHDLAGRRLAVSEDLGSLPVQAEVRAVIRAAAEDCAAAGAVVEQAHPDLAGAMDVFQIQRAMNVRLTAQLLDREVPDWRAYAKDTAVWNFEQGLSLTVEDVSRSEVERTRIYQRVCAFFETFDALVLPAAQVVPFPVESEWVHEIEGVEMPTYLDWMRVCCMISITGLPSISVPGGFTPAGLPVGVQIVGPPRGDRIVLEIAHAFEAIRRNHLRRPKLADLVSPA